MEEDYPIRHQNRINRKVARRRNHDSLSSQERRVIELVRNGFVHKQIADKMCIAETTVSKHVQNMMPKLRAKNAPHMVNNYLLQNYAQ